MREEGYEHRFTSNKRARVVCVLQVYPVELNLFQMFSYIPSVINIFDGCPQMDLWELWSRVHSDNKWKYITHSIVHDVTQNLQSLFADQ